MFRQKVLSLWKKFLIFFFSVLSMIILQNPSSGVLPVYSQVFLKTDRKWSLILAIPTKYTRERENGLPGGDAPRAEAPKFGASPRRSPFSRVRVYFAGIDKIRDYSQSILQIKLSIFHPLSTLAAGVRASIYPDGKNRLRQERSLLLSRLALTHAYVPLIN